MGTDDLHHKKRAKGAKDLARRQAKKSTRAHMLIVCEGEKTEPLYFKGLKNYYKLNSANIEICGKECDNNPLKIVRHAEDVYTRKKNVGYAFDKVYCVFDKDGHADYKNAIDAIKKKKPKNLYCAITSVPCFEYWIVLHFKYMTRHFDRCDKVLSELKKHIPDYAKANDNIFKKLIHKLDDAKKNAAKALKEAESLNTDNPSTNVHELGSVVIF